MDWPGIQTALPTVLATATGIPASAFVWDKRGAGWMTSPHVRLRVLGGIRTIGRDERRTTYDAGSDVNRERVYGNRAIPVSFRFETLTQALGDSAYALAETVRAALTRTDVLDALRDQASLGVSRIEAIRVEDYTDEEDRLRSLAVLDVTFLAHISVTGADVGYIDHVNATATIKDPAGADVHGSPIPIAWNLPDP